MVQDLMWSINIMTSMLLNHGMLLMEPNPPKHLVSLHYNSTQRVSLQRHLTRPLWLLLRKVDKLQRRLLPLLRIEVAPFQILSNQNETNINSIAETKLSHLSLVVVAVATDIVQLTIHKLLKDILILLLLAVFIIMS